MGLNINNTTRYINSTTGYPSIKINNTDELIKISNPDELKIELGSPINEEMSDLKLGGINNRNIQGSSLNTHYNPYAYNQELLAKMESVKPGELSPNVDHSHLGGSLDFKA